MKFKIVLSAVGCAIALLATPAFAGEKTCCQKTDLEGKDCTHKCCVAAHKEGKSCLKCNPGKEDLKLIKKTQKKPDKVADKK